MQPAGLRSAEEQLWLSRLSQAPAIRLLASVDHVNAALLWNSRVAAAFNWLWVDGTTYATYDAETQNVAPIITSKASSFVCWIMTSFAGVLCCCVRWPCQLHGMMAEVCHTLPHWCTWGRELFRPHADADSPG